MSKLEEPPYEGEVTNYRLENERLITTTGDGPFSSEVKWDSESELQDFVKDHLATLLALEEESSRSWNLGDGRGAGGADIVSVDDLGRVTVVEVKKGTVSAPVIGQLYRYLRLLSAAQTLDDLIERLWKPYGAQKDEIEEQRKAALAYLKSTLPDKKPEIYGIAVARNVTGSARRLLSDLGSMEASRTTWHSIQAWGLTRSEDKRYRLHRFSPTKMPDLGKYKDFKDGDLITDDEWFCTGSERVFRLVRRPDGLRAYPADRNGTRKKKGKSYLFENLDEPWRYIRLRPSE